MNALTPARRILLVEAEPSHQILLATILQEDGYHAEAVSSLEAALSKVHTQLYDLVLMDLLTETAPTRGDITHLHGALHLRQQCYPIPVGLLTAWQIDLAAAERAGFVFALRKPFDLDVVLRRIVDCLNAPFTPEQQQQAQVLRRFLESVSQGDEGALRRLCTPTVAFYPLTGSAFTQERAILGIDAYLAYVRLVHQRLLGFRLEHVAIFAHKGRLIARYLLSWLGLDEQRQWVTGSVQCRFRGELIAQIGEALPTQWLREALGAPQAQSEERSRLS